MHSFPEFTFQQQMQLGNQFYTVQRYLVSGLPPTHEPQTTTFTGNASHPRRSKRAYPRTSPEPVPASTGRKRVNPDSLAARLGPEIVRELESLLKPGMTEMPHFSVRQAIQKRYNVNRRHIYDWFHSKGLRVTREDSRADDTHAVRQVKQKLQHGPRLQANAIGDLSDSNTSSPDLLMTPSNFGPGHGVYGMRTGDDPSVLKPSIHTGNPFVPSLYAPPFDEFHSCHPDAAAIAVNQLYAVPGNASALAPSSYSQIPAASVADKTSLQMPSSDVSYVSANSAPAVPANSNNRMKENADPLASADYQDFFSRPERQAIYQSLSNAVGPACGIQESVGTYKAFMQKQTQKYFERLLPVDTDSPVSSNLSKTNQQSPRHSQSVPEVTPSGSISLGVIEQRRLGSSGWNVSGSQETRFHNSDVSPHNGHLFQDRSGPSLAPSPESISNGIADIPNQASRGSPSSGDALALGDILESPVLRSRNPTAEQVPHSVATPFAFDQGQGFVPQFMNMPVGQGLGIQSVPPVYQPMVLHQAATWEDFNAAHYAHLLAPPAAVQWDFSLLPPVWGLDVPELDRGQGRG